MDGKVCPDCMIPFGADGSCGCFHKGAAPKYSGNELYIHEWPQPACEIVSLSGGGVAIRDPEDAKAVIESLTRLLEEMDAA